jgi:type II secretory pathway component GspD/PulD (secretin)
MKDTTTRTATKVPVLGSLPVIGKLFRKDADSSERSNLLIFVTASVMSPSGAQVVTDDPGA